MSRLRKALGGKKTFMLWFLSYILVLLVPVTVYLAMYSSVTGAAKAEVERANSMMLSQFLQFMDNSLSEVEQAAFSIYNDTKIQSLMYKTWPLSPSSVYKIVDIQKDLRNFRTSNLNINNIYVYCKRSDLLVSIDSIYLRGDTGHIYSQLTDLTQDDWEAALLNTRLPLYHIFKWRAEKSNVDFDKLTYCRPFPYAYTENMAGMVIILIDLEQLKQKFLKSYSEKDQYFIIDAGGGVLALNQNPNFTQSIDFSPLNASGDGLQQGLIDVPGYTCLSVKSQVNDWIYVRFMDSTDVRKRIGALNISFAISLGVSLIVGTLISFILTKYNYNPLKHLKLLLVGGKEEAPAAAESDFQYIIRQVRNLQIEKDNIKRELDMQSSVVRNAMLTHMMKGEMNGAELERECGAQGIHADRPQAVILAALEESGAGTLSGEQQTILIANLFTKVFNRACLQGFVTEMDPEMVACLTLLDTEKGEEEALADMKAAIGEAAAILAAAKLDVTVTMAYSAVHAGIGEAHASYIEAREALEYGWLTGARMPLDYSAIKGKASVSGFMQQALQNDHHFINCVRALDFAGARRSLNEIIDMELSDGGYSVRMSKFRMYGLISMLIGTVGELGGLFGGAPFDSRHYIERLSNCRTLQELRSLVGDMLDNVGRLYDEQSRSKVQNGIKEARKFIDRNYLDPNLNVSMVAGAMNLHPSYLTQLFKRETGHNTMDYIHMKRLNAAKELLMKHKIKDVASKVGYSDVRTLIRLFRKYEGITPGKFKEIGGADTDDDVDRAVRPSRAI